LKAPDRMGQPDGKKKKKSKKKSGKPKPENSDKNDKSEPENPPPATPDFLQRFGLKQRAKTSIDFGPRRQSSEDENGTFERRPSSFRRRINSFIQNNSPFLQRAGHMKRNEALKQVEKSK